MQALKALVFTYYKININAFFPFLLVLATNNLQATYRNFDKTKLNAYTYICWTLGLLINDCAWKKEELTFSRLFIFPPSRLVIQKSFKEVKSPFHLNCLFVGLKTNFREVPDCVVLASVIAA